jgi:hypothetical protein
MSFDSLDALQDLEIYAQIDALDAIEGWLTAHFGTITPLKATGRTRTYNADWQGQPVEVFVCRNAGHTGFSSITFNRKQIPWGNDVECARAAHQALGVTIRCSESAWKEGDDPDQWYQVAASGESVIHWPNPA